MKGDSLIVLFAFSKFITSWSYTEPEHSEAEVAVANDGTVYALFNGPKDVGVETFVQD